jgi:hypothetical protein
LAHITFNGTAKILVWIQMNFYPNPSGITSQETFLALSHLQGLAKNPVLEAILLHAPPFHNIRSRNSDFRLMIFSETMNTPSPM